MAEAKDDLHSHFDKTAFLADLRKLMSRYDDLSVSRLTDILNALDEFSTLVGSIQGDRCLSEMGM